MNPEYVTTALQFARGQSHFLLNPNAVVAVHGLYPRGDQPAGTRIICATAVGRECVTSYAVTTDPLEEVLERLRPFGLGLEEFDGPRGKSHIATAKIFEVSPRHDGAVPGSFLKLAVGDGVYWPCSVLAPVAHMIAFLGVDA